MKNPKPNKVRKSLPHNNVYTRLKPSDIHGVGVFAVRPIPKGVPIFRGDDAPIVWVKKSELKGLRGEERRLYDDFCIIKDKGQTYGCPVDFNNLTVAWFLNEPKVGQYPNVACREDYTFYALRKIAVGEELTVNYNTFSERPNDHNRQ